MSQATQTPAQDAAQGGAATPDLLYTEDETALRDAVHGALANYAQADARFQAGLGNAVELADAEA